MSDDMHTTDKTESPVENRITAELRRRDPDSSRPTQVIDVEHYH